VDARGVARAVDVAAVAGVDAFGTDDRGAVDVTLAGLLGLAGFAVRAGFADLVRVDTATAGDSRAGRKGFGPALADLECA
jgi:hypothetical protein